MVPTGKISTKAVPTLTDTRIKKSTFQLNARILKAVDEIGVRL